MFALDGPEMTLRPRYNLAPSQLAAVVRNSPHGRELVWLRWGLIPSWAKDPRIGHRLINARAETVADQPAFRDADARRCCLVPAEGCYEWPRHGSVRQPWWIARRDGLGWPVGSLAPIGRPGKVRVSGHIPSRGVDPNLHDPDYRSSGLVAVDPCPDAGDALA